MTRRLALLIGNQRFDDGSGFEPLKGPHNDVDALAEVLRDEARGGFAEVQCLKDAAHRDMARAVRRLLRSATAEDELLIHYSGHGQPDEDGRLFFAAADSHAEELAVTALRAGDLQEWMAKSPARSVVLLLDCCFAGAFGKVLTGGLRGPVESGIQQQLREAAAKGRYILTSSTSWQTSLESEGEADGRWMGHFTRAVVERLRSEAGGADEWVRFSHLAAHVRSAFPGQDPREFRADAEGDPGIVRSTPRETPEQRREALLIRWLDAGDLPAFVYGPAFNAVHGRGSAALVRKVADLLDAPGMTPGAFAAAVRNALPGDVPPVSPPWTGMAPASPARPSPPAPPAPPPKRTAEPRRVWLLLAIPLAAAAYVAIDPPWPGETTPPGSYASAPTAPPVPDVTPAIQPVVTPPATPPRPVPPAPGTIIRDCDDVCPKMVVIPEGSFEMGTPDGETDAESDERPRRRVTVLSIAVGKFEVTFAQWDACVAAGGCGGHRPDDRGWGRDDRPVINVSWNDAQAYVAWLNERTRARRGTAVYRLLTEAEWEYACRAGTSTPFSFGPTISTAQANYNGDFTYGNGQKGEYRQRTVPVGSLPANFWGLHEMHGNVWEWVEDAYGPYPAQTTDAAALLQTDTTLRVLRGGSWNDKPRDLRCGNRIRNETQYRHYVFGFRVARTLF